MSPKPIHTTALLVSVLALTGAPSIMAREILAGKIIENVLGMRFVHIPAGSFVMGTADPAAAAAEVADPDPAYAEDETPAHEVTISRPFYMGQTEVTQGVWLEVMENQPGPAAWWEGDDWARLPVAAVSWNMAARFVEELNRMDPAHRYRLPTEAEWEYAARAGTTGLRPVATEALPDHAWYIANSGDHPHAVATREPNAFGLYDTLGNVWEWVADDYAPDTYTAAPRRDPQGPTTSRSKVRRGGSYHCPEHQIRPAYRGANAPHVRYTVLGLRVVAEPRHGP
ncbi:MAG: formylglycine-generating enzyme family protein [Gammaproteobacteria bacterium]|nr:formylglycine-generating enzyme family protein [Gammaproteobacteria bacterium]